MSTVKELKAKCKKRNIRGYSNLNKKELMKLCGGKKKSSSKKKTLKNKKKQAREIMDLIMFLAHDDPGSDQHTFMLQAVHRGDVKYLQDDLKEYLGNMTVAQAQKQFAKHNQSKATAKSKSMGKVVTAAKKLIQKPTKANVKNLEVQIDNYTSTV